MWEYIASAVALFHRDSAVRGVLLWATMQGQRLGPTTEGQAFSDLSLCRRRPLHAFVSHHPR
eukprot:5438893-Pyramimonas_sp.AAC.1